jgi:hypothetical protein
MVKFLALAVAVVVSLVAVDMAQAGRRCKSCGGCPGGVCHVEVVPVAAVTNAPPAAVVKTEVAPAAVQPAPQYYTSARRGLFGWRR